MKRILLATVLLALAVTVYGQKVIGGNLEAIKDVQQIQVSFDYKDALIQGMIYEDLWQRNKESSLIATITILTRSGKRV